MSRNAYLAYLNALLRRQALLSEEANALDQSLTQLEKTTSVKEMVMQGRNLAFIHRPSPEEAEYAVLDTTLNQNDVVIEACDKIMSRLNHLTKVPHCPCRFILRGEAESLAQSATALSISDPANTHLRSVLAETVRIARMASAYQPPRDAQPIGPQLPGQNPCPLNTEEDLEY